MVSGRLCFDRLSRISIELREIKLEEVAPALVLGLVALALTYPTGVIARWRGVILLVYMRRTLR